MEEVTADQSPSIQWRLKRCFEALQDLECTQTAQKVRVVMVDTWYRVEYFCTIYGSG